MLTKLLIAVIAFLGLMVGYLLTVLAKEEIKPGKKYFLILQRVLLLALALVLLSQVWTKKVFIIPFILGIVVGYFLQFRYLYLGLALAASITLSVDFFVIVASLVFLHGLPYGSISSKLKLPFHALFFFIPVIIMIFFSPNNADLLLPFVAGGLILQK